MMVAANAENNSAETKSQQNWLIAESLQFDLGKCWGALIDKSKWIRSDRFTTLLKQQWARLFDINLFWNKCCFLRSKTLIGQHTWHSTVSFYGFSCPKTMARDWYRFDIVKYHVWIFPVCFFEGSLYHLDKGSSFRLCAVFISNETLFILLKWWIDRVLIDMNLNKSTV